MPVGVAPPHCGPRTTQCGNLPVGVRISVRGSVLRLVARGKVVPLERASAPAARPPDRLELLRAALRAPRLRRPRPPWPRGSGGASLEGVQNASVYRTSTRVFPLSLSLTWLRSIAPAGASCVLRRRPHVSAERPTFLAPSSIQIGRASAMPRSRRYDASAHWSSITSLPAALRRSFGMARTSRSHAWRSRWRRSSSRSRLACARTASATMIEGSGGLAEAARGATLCVLVAGKTVLQYGAPRGDDLPEVPRGVALFSLPAFYALLLPTATPSWFDMPSSVAFRRFAALRGVDSRSRYPFGGSGDSPSRLSLSLPPLGSIGDRLEYPPRAGRGAMPRTRGREDRLCTSD